MKLSLVVTLAVALILEGYHVIATDCGCPSTCTQSVLQTVANGRTCARRINRVMNEGGLSERDACREVGKDFPNECGACEPDYCDAPRCGCSRCDSTALSRLATDQNGSFSCGSRIDWGMDNRPDARSVQAACGVVGQEFPEVCGRACDPTRCNNEPATPEDWSYLCDYVYTTDDMKDWLSQYFESNMCSFALDFFRGAGEWCAAAGFAILDSNFKIKCCREPLDPCYAKLTQYCPNSRGGDYLVRSSQNSGRRYAC